MNNEIHFEDNGMYRYHSLKGNTELLKCTWRNELFYLNHFPADGNYIYGNAIFGRYSKEHVLSSQWERLPNAEAQGYEFGLL